MEDQNAEPDEIWLQISFPAEFVLELFRRLDRMQTPVIQWNADQQVMNVAVIEALKADAQNVSQKLAEACYHTSPAVAIERLTESVDRCREHNAILRR
jgi:hypothetical protein